MRTLRAVFVCLCAALIALAQTDRGTITGTVQDQGSAMVPGAKVSVRNIETGATSETVTTSTGNFTLAQLPAGTYELSIEAPGFKKYVGQGTQVQVAQTVRLDILLEIGSTTESVTVEATAPLLRTENAEQSVNVNVNGDRINSLPLNFGGGAGAIGAVRNQMAFVVLSPGVTGLTPSNTSATGTPDRVNGFPRNTFRIMIEGQDTTSGNTQGRVDETQASVEAIEEFSLQTANFSAEYGQALGGVFNFTIRSGTNQFHGSGYEYFVNEALAAHRPYTGLRPTSRKHDFGGTVGGPVMIPKLYNGRKQSRFVSLLTRDWMIGGLLRYPSGVALGIPNSTNGLNTQLLLPNATVQNRVSSEPLFLKDLNCHCIDPTKELALNPKAWVDTPAGQWGTAAAAYNDFRSQKFPDEQMSIGRTFRIKGQLPTTAKAASPADSASSIGRIRISRATVSSSPGFSGRRIRSKEITGGSDG